MANMATASLIYRKTGSAGVPEVNTLATLKTDLGLSGSNSGDAAANSSSATAAQGVLAAAALPKGGGAMTGAITTNSTFDGVDIATRDGVLSSTTTTAAAALPKAGGAMTGAITTNSTFDGVDVGTRDGVLSSTTTTAAAALPKAGGAMTGAITTNSTFDGVDIATRDGILSSTTTTANAALPKGGGTMSGAIAMGGNNITGGGTGAFTDMTVTGNLTVSGTSTVVNSTVETVSIADAMIKLRAGASSWVDCGFIFERGGAAPTSNGGIVDTAARDAAMWYDAATGHLTVGEVDAGLNEGDNTPDDISGYSNTDNIHQIALCSVSTSAGADKFAPIGSIHVDSDDDSGTPYVRVS